tara:strand:- start:155 stop:295 length:141 start_codon:yes stop_codon:yes gene_type:complete
MEYKELFEAQVELLKKKATENQKLKQQIHVLETILRTQIPVIENQR